MNNMPKELDTVLSLLGELDLLKGAVDNFDKSVHIALADDQVSASLSNSQRFSTLKKVESVRTTISDLNVEILNIAETLASDIKEMVKPPKTTATKNKENKQRKENKDPKRGDVNPLVNNVLQYIKERMEGADKKDE